VVPEPGEFSLDAEMPPPRILPSQPGDELAQLVVNRRPTKSTSAGLTLAFGLYAAPDGSHLHPS
jgi:hypothetical protein